MRYIHLLMVLVALCSGLSRPLTAQTTCGPEPVGNAEITGTAFFNYGSQSRSTNQKNRLAVALGQTFVGYVDGLENNSTLGFYARFQLPPFGVILHATQGDLLDRIQLTWEVDALGPAPSDGFNIYRDGVFLATVGSNIRNYNDFNVIPGVPYTYTVRGINVYGEGAGSTALGFQVPNGVVTGQVQTVNGNPVPGALITLTPMQGFSARFASADGAFASDSAGFLPASGNPWSLAFWMKTESATANGGILNLDPFPLAIRAMNSAGGSEGVIASIAGAPQLAGAFPTATKHGWHHIAFTFDGQQGRLYLDGVLAAAGLMSNSSAATTLNLGSLTGFEGWNGRLDDLRLYHRLLDEIDFGEIMEGTATSATPGLKYYWKMDEEKGVKSFDIFQRNKMYFCGAVFDADRPPLHTAAVSDADGYYKIESASYGTGITFQAKPSKLFFAHRSLKFTRAESDYATLPDFALANKSTIELWVNNTLAVGNQCLLAKKWGGNEFRLFLTPNGLQNELKLYLNGTEQNFGPLGNGYQHLALTIDSGSGAVAAYKNGILLNAVVFSGISGNWSDAGQPWLVGARNSGGGQTDYFHGLIDELAIYDTTLALSDIQAHFQASRDPQGKGLRAYFAFDEGSGNRLGNTGALLTGSGSTFGTEWSAFCAKQTTTPHEFSPATRQVTLNPSVTSVDQIDFDDRSTIGVSGYVRYAGTDCFAEGVEILVNGQSYNPKILTDSVGKFVIDFDPGTTATLAPKLGDHVFSPALWELTNVVNPLAGILFYDTEKRKITGKVAGGWCKASILDHPGTPSGTVCRVKVRSKNGCLERIVTLDNEAGFFEFTDLPPMEMTVAVVEHSDPKVKTAFQVQGGAQVDLTTRDTSLDFTYFAQPEIVIAHGLEPFSPSCDVIVLDQGTTEEMEIHLVEKYHGSTVSTCVLDSGSVAIIDGFGVKIEDTLVYISQGKAIYHSRIGPPNPTPPYLKTIQFIGSTLEGNETEFTTQAIVTGVRPKQETFTTVTPEIPLLVLHDPPGDGSYAYLEKDSSVCMNLGLSEETELGGGAVININLAPTLTWDSGPFGPSNEFHPILGGTVDFAVTKKVINDTDMEVCLTAKQRIATSDGGLIVGGAQGGDVYMGGAFNVIFGNADKVSFNDTICEPVLTPLVVVNPDSFATTYMYSEWYIRTQIMYHLANIIQGIKNDPGQNLADTLQYHNSIQRWQNILNQNKVNKSRAKFVRNLSYDAGVEYEYSEQSDTAHCVVSSTEIISLNEIAVNSGTYVNNLGSDASVKVIVNNIKGSSSASNTTQGVTIGYVLKDDDPGDGYTIDVGIDSMYKTPVFNIKAGQSSCPWEPGTAKREGVILTSVDGSTRVDVPANEPAVYHLVMGTNSATNETFTYGFTAGPESNSKGAKIFCNGAPMNVIQWYAIPYGTSLPVVVTVERTDDYDYDSMEIVLYSVCEDLRANALGILPDTAVNLYSAIYLSAHFIEPCSEVEIHVPEQGWVIHPDTLPGNENLLQITLSEYDTSDVDLGRIRVQFRRSDGDGAWINAGPDLPKSALGPLFTQFYWDTEGLQDGDYEIRAVAICTGDLADRPGYSHVIKGRIDRQPPSLVGVPQPSDGVYQVGDEISFTFNKPVNCSKIIPADMVNENNIGLYDASTGALIDANITCVDNKIVIDPLFQNEYFENRILRAGLHNIQDLTGNVLVGTEWEFYVDRNELAWLTDSIGATLYAGESKTITASIHNRGGYPVPFSIQQVPSWVHVTPNAGTLVPNEIRPIQFKIDSTLAIGLWSDLIVLHTETGQNPFFMGGDEGLPIGARVICQPPNWTLNPGPYELTMNLTVRLKIGGLFSADVEDQVGVFIDGQLRGAAKMQYLPAYGYWVAFLTVYGNTADANKALVFEIFDASTCTRYPGTFSATFVANSVLGSAASPGTVTSSTLVLRDIPLAKGWNWISFNLGFPNPAINSVLANLPQPLNDLIKDQTKFSTFNNPGWSGSLSTITNKSLYLYQANQANTLKMVGTPIAPSSVPIPVVSGWNWISFVPNFPMPVKTALASLPAQIGDIIKSQTAFAQYTGVTNGWVGSLTQLKPPNGYLLKMTLAGTLTYPNQVLAPEPEVLTRGERPSETFWTVDPALYEHNMTLIGMFRADSANATTATMELGAFAGDELRGSAPAIYIESMQAYLFFLTSYANTSGELLHFKLFDGESGAVQNLAETMTFTPNQHQGSVDEPLPFDLEITGVQEAGSVHSFEIQPNPFNTETTFRFVLSGPQEIDLSIADVNGREVFTMHTLAQDKLNAVRWKGQSNTGQSLASGVYFVRLKTEQGVVTRRVVLER